MRSLPAIIIVTSLVVLAAGSSRAVADDDDGDGDGDGNEDRGTFAMFVDARIGYQGGGPLEGRHAAILALEGASYTFNTISPVGGSLVLDMSGTINREKELGGEIALYPFGWAFGDGDSGVALMGGVGASAAADRVPAAFELPVRLTLFGPWATRLEGTAILARSSGEPRRFNDLAYRVTGSLTVSVPMHEAGDAEGMPVPSTFMGVAVSSDDQVTTFIATFGSGVAIY